MTRTASALRWAGLLTGALSLSCTPTPVNPPPDAPPTLDGGVLHSYRCPIGDSGAGIGSESYVYWTCQDGLTTPTGTCPATCIQVVSP